MNWRALKSLSIYAVVGFWPVGFYAAGVVFLISHESPARNLVSFLEGLAFLVLPVAAVGGSHAIFRAQKSWRARTWVVYGTWCFIAFLCAYIVSASFGGVSMAVVEGVASAFRFVQYAVFALPLLLLAHIVIVPYVIFTIAVLRRANGKLDLWDVDAAAS